MPRFSAAGRGTTAATAEHVSAQLWNPHASMMLYVWEITCYWVASTAYVAVRRSTARGATPASTVTPDADNALDRRAAPVSGALLDLGAFGTQPTITANLRLYRGGGPTNVGQALGIFFPIPVGVPAGTGLCICTNSAAILNLDTTFVWEE